MIFHIFFEDGTKVEISSEIKWIFISLVYVLVCRNLWIRHEGSNLIVLISIFVSSFLQLNWPTLFWLKVQFRFDLLQCA